MIGMKKVCLWMVVCCMILQCFVPIWVRAEELPVIMITYADDEMLSREHSVEAQMTLVQEGMERVVTLALRLDDETLDYVERLLPQKSLRIEDVDECFILYNGGNDGINTAIISAVCCNLIEQGPIDVPVRAQEPVNVYLNEEYWGMYTWREDIVDAITHFEGLKDKTSLNVRGVNKDTIHGDISGITEAIERVKSLNLALESDQQKLDKLLDADSFLNWLAVNSYFGVGNFLSEVVFYQIDDGPVKCAMGDMAYAFFTAESNPFATLDEYRAVHLDAAVLANMMLEQPVYRDAFLYKLGILYQTFTTSLMQEVVDAENARIASALPAHMSRWVDEFRYALADEYRYSPADVQEALLYQQYRVYRLRDKTVVCRPWYVYDIVQSELNVSDEDMVRYFGGIKPEQPVVDGDNWEAYKATHLK